MAQKMPQGPSQKRLLLAALGFSLICGAAFATFHFVKRKSPQLKSPTTADEEARTNPTLIFPYTQLGSDAVEQNTEAPAPRLTIELAVLEDKREAEALVKKFVHQGLDAYFTPYQQKGFVYYRVRLGVFASESAAEAPLAAARTLAPRAHIVKL